MRGIRKFKSSTSGASAIEFAIVAPVFLMMAFAIVAYGIYFGTAHAVRQVSAEAARASVAGIGQAERESLARQSVSETIGNYPFLLPSQATVTAQQDPADAGRLVVTVRYNATHLGLAAFAAFLPVPPDAICHSSVIRRGGF